MTRAGRGAFLPRAPNSPLPRSQFSAESDEVLYAAAGRSGLLKSVDGGRSFGPINAGLPTVGYPCVGHRPARAPHALHGRVRGGGRSRARCSPLRVARRRGELVADQGLPALRLHRVPLSARRHPPDRLGDLQAAGRPLRLEDALHEQLVRGLGEPRRRAALVGQPLRGDREHLHRERRRPPDEAGPFLLLRRGQDRRPKHGRRPPLSALFAEVHRPANYYCSTCAAPSRFTEGWSSTG